MTSDYEAALQKHGYEMGRFLGKGATADCFEVFSKNFHNRSFACKIIDIFPHDKKEQMIRAFTEEVKLLSQLDHPNIIRCYDFFEENETMYMILENCEFGGLNQLISTKPEFVRQNCVRYSVEIVDALLNCHTLGVAHLDIKPHNIFVNKYNKTKLSDFGFSKMVKHGDKIDKKIGSRLFMAPEIGSGPYDPYKADIYSLGVTLLFIADPYYFKQFSPNFFYDEALGVARNLGELGLLITDCMNRNPDERPSIFDVFNRLRRIQMAEAKHKMIPMNTLHKKVDSHPIQSTKSQKSVIYFKPIMHNPSKRLLHSHVHLGPSTSLKSHAFPVI